MANLNGRLRTLRKDVLHLTQAQIAERLGITRGAIAKIESGDGQPSTQLLKGYSREFNVRQAWLETGEEPIFEPPTEADELAQLLKGASASPTKALLLRIIASLPDYLLVDLRREIRQIMRKLPPQPPDEE